MSHSAQFLERRSDLIERVEAGLRAIDRIVNDRAERGEQAQRLIDGLIGEGAVSRFTAGTHEFSLHGVRASSTAGELTALRRWLEKAKVLDFE